MYDPNTVMNFLDDELELGASKKKKKRKLGSKIKKGLKVVASGGLSLAAPALKKTKIGKKIVKGVKALATGGISLIKDKKVAAKAKKAVKKVKALVKKAPIKKAAKLVAKVQDMGASDCSSNDGLAKLVAAKIVSVFGPPLDESNKILAQMALQRQATYEHKKLMQDDEFRRKVLTHIASKARKGNCSCKRTLLALGS